MGEEGIEEAFEFVSEINERWVGFLLSLCYYITHANRGNHPFSVKTGCWVGDCFIYTNSTNRLNYLVGGQTSTLSHFDTTIYLLGYIPRDNRVYVTDKDLNVSSYALPLSLIKYQTAVLRGDLATADSLLPSVPEDQRNRVAKFLEGQNLKEQALAVSADPEHRFELAIQLQKLDVAYEIARTLDQEDKWKTVGDKALEFWQFGLAEESMRRAKDLEGLLLMYQAGGNGQGLKDLAEMAVKGGRNNIAFMCYLLRGEIEQCIDLLISTDRIPEAALLARTYLPSQIPRTVDLWRNSLVEGNKHKVAEAIAGPEEHEDLFPDFRYGLFAEDRFKRMRDKGPVSAAEYLDWKESLDVDIIGREYDVLRLVRFFVWLTLWCHRFERTIPGWSTEHTVYSQW